VVDDKLSRLVRERAQLSLRHVSRGCHGKISEEGIRALYPYSLWIRAQDAYPKFIKRKKGAVISILSDRNCEMISDPYPGYESQDTGISKIMNLLAPLKIYFSAVDLPFRVPTIGEFSANVLQRKAAILPGPEETRQTRD